MKQATKQANNHQPTNQPTSQPANQPTKEPSKQTSNSLQPALTCPKFNLIPGESFPRRFDPVPVKSQKGGCTNLWLGLYTPLQTFIYPRLDCGSSSSTSAPKWLMFSIWAWNPSRWNTDGTLVHGQKMIYKQLLHFCPIPSIATKPPPILISPHLERKRLLGGNGGAFP